MTSASPTLGKLARNSLISDWRDCQARLTSIFIVAEAGDSDHGGRGYERASPRRACLFAIPNSYVDAYVKTIPRKKSIFKDGSAEGTHELPAEAERARLQNC